jgi:hypothetical protein
VVKHMNAPTEELIVGCPSHATLLVLLNATAAAASFVTAFFLAERVADSLEPLVIVLGLVGVAFFTRQAEAYRRLRRIRAAQRRSG